MLWVTKRGSQGTRQVGEQVACICGRTVVLAFCDQLDHHHMTLLTQNTIPMHVLLKVDENGKPVMNTNSKKCENAWADDDNVIHDGPYERNEDISGGPYSDDLSSDEKQLRHNTGWNNQFAFPWEVSAFWNFTTR